MQENLPLDLLYLGLWKEENGREEET